MEEHFRKSLGEEYSKLFHQQKKKEEGGPPREEVGAGRGKEREEDRGMGVEERGATEGGGGGVVVKGERMDSEDAVKAFKDDVDMSGYTGNITTKFIPQIRAEKVHKKLG